MAGLKTGHYTEELGAEMVGAPGFYRLFNGFDVGEFFSEDFLGQGGKFGITGDAQGDEVGRSEFADARLQVGEEQAFETQALFEADDAVLNLKGEDARKKKGKQDRQGGKDTNDGIERKMQSHGVVDGPAEIQNQDRQSKIMKRRDHLDVICKILFVHFHSSVCVYKRFVS